MSLQGETPVPLHIKKRSYEDIVRWTSTRQRARTQKKPNPKYLNLELKALRNVRK
jgi:hypothetical protein